MGQIIGMIIGIGLIPVLLGLATTLALRARLRGGAVWWAGAGGVGLAVILLVATQLFASNVVDDFWGTSNRGTYSFLIVAGLFLWFLGVGVGSAVSNRRDPPEF
jgi:hypothetical protein